MRPYVLVIVGSPEPLLQRSSPLSCRGITFQHCSKWSKLEVLRLNRFLLDSRRSHGRIL